MVIWFVNTIYMCLIHTSWEISVVVWCKCLQMKLFCYAVPKLERGLCPPCVWLYFSHYWRVCPCRCMETHTHTHTHTTDGYVARLQAALNSTGLPQDQPLRAQSANVHKAAPQPYIMYTLEFTIMSQFLFLQLISTDFNCPPLNGIKPATDNGMYTYTITIYGIALCVKVIIGCVPHAWISETDIWSQPSHLNAFLVWDTCSSPHFPVTPAQLMRSGFGKIHPAQWVTLRNSTLGLPFFFKEMWLIDCSCLWLS